MFKGPNKLIFIFVGLFALIILTQYLLPKPTDWNRNYLSKNKSPFGSYAVYNLLEDLFKNQPETSDKTLYLFNDLKRSDVSLLIVNDAVNFGKNDLNALYAMLERGNTVFIAANEFTGIIADSLHIHTAYNFYNYLSSVDSLIGKSGVQIELMAGNLKNKKYNYPRLLAASYFSNFDSTRFKVLACFDKNKACLIGTKIKKGKLFLASVPDVFSNYFIAEHENRHFAYALLSLLDREKTPVWDEHYKTYNVTNYSIIQFILNSDPLYMAYLLLIFAIICYMLFEGKRRQRAIPLLTPPSNTTLDFVNVISHVYYNSKNHRHIAIEKIKFFYETIRRRFNVDTSTVNEALWNEITSLSGVDQKQVRQLFLYCEQVKNAAEITEYDLVELNRQITNFNKHSLR